VQQYHIKIPNTKATTYKLFVFLVLCLNFIGFGFVFLQATGAAQYFAIAGMLFNAVCWLYYLLNKKHLKKPITELAIAASATIWFYVGNIWLAAGLVLFAAMAWVINKEFVVIVNKSGITYPSFPVKKYTWHQVNQVLLKGDVLTLDFKNNQFLQFTLEEQVLQKIDAAKFNEFCKSQIATL
jgi:hypothetical protein